MQKNFKAKFQVNSFMSSSRLIKSFNSNAYNVVKQQSVDVICGKWSMIILTMQYHIKFPRFFINKLNQLINKCDFQKMIVVVIIEN